MSLSIRLSRRHLLLLFGIMLLPIRQGQAQTRDDDLARPTRLFLAKVIGADREARKKHAIAVIEAADRTLDVVPDDLSVLMLKAAALGTAARASSFSDSVSERYGSRADNIIETLNEKLPDHPWTLTLSGLWNFEVVRRGGSIGAVMLGASTEQGVKDLDRAMSLIGRSDPAISFAYAVVLLATDPEEHADQARLMLRISSEVAARQDPEDAIVRATTSATVQFMVLLDKRDFDALEEMAVESF